MNDQEPKKNRYQEKRSRPGAFLSGITIVRCLGGMLLVLNLVLLYGIFFSSGGVLGFRQQSRQVSELEAKIRRLKTENHRSFRKIEAIKNDAQALERLVRQQLGWVRENELMVEFPQAGIDPGKEGKKP